MCPVDVKDKVHKKCGSGKTAPRAAAEAAKYAMRAPFFEME
jgi:hypothetical protein